MSNCGADAKENAATAARRLQTGAQHLHASIFERLARHGRICRRNRAVLHPPRLCIRLAGQRREEIFHVDAGFTWRRLRDGSNCSLRQVEDAAARTRPTAPAGERVSPQRGGDSTRPAAWCDAARARHGGIAAMTPATGTSSNWSFFLPCSAMPEDAHARLFSPGQQARRRRPGRTWDLVGPNIVWINRAVAHRSRARCACRPQPPDCKRADCPDQRAGLAGRAAC